MDVLLGTRLMMLANVVGSRSFAKKILNGC